MKIITLFEFVSAVEMMREYQKSDITQDHRVAKKWEAAVDTYITDFHKQKQEDKPKSTPESMRQFYTIKEAGRIFRVSRQTIHRMIKTGKIPIKRIGRRVLVPAASLMPKGVAI
jgi:excisionase family DNA binding protein